MVYCITIKKKETKKKHNKLKLKKTQKYNYILSITKQNKTKTHKKQKTKKLEIDAQKKPKTLWFNHFLIHAGILRQVIAFCY